jgi:ribosomal protein S12 methylthiotransferase accessory factor
MIVPRLFNIDFTSDTGRQLLAAIAAKHGARLAAASGIPQRLFGLASPLAPNLRFVGAEALVERSEAVPAGGQVFSLGGAGLELEDAAVSCLGEGVERLSQVERSGDIAITAPIASVRDRLLPQSAALVDEIAAAAQPSTTFDWVAAADLTTGAEVLLPADWCLRRASHGSLCLPNTALSTGVAAGPTAEGAAARAILELVERDAVALWWVGGRRGRPIALESAATAEATQLVTHIRHGERSRASWLLDVTTDLDIPCAVALSVAPDGKGLVCGMAARLTMAEAARAAIFEMCQMELALLVVALKRQQRGDEALNAVDRQHVARAAALDARTCDLLHPLGAPRDTPAVAAESDVEALAILQSAFAARQVEVALVDLTRVEYGIPVMAAIAPVLQRFPSDLRTARLQAAIDATGGGASWTGGIPLL